jgi:hypothetical protein
VIPIALILAGGLVKTVVRKEPRLSDYYLGLDYALASLATAATYGIDLANRTIPGTDQERLDKSVKVWVFVVFTCFVSLVLIIMHQLWEPWIDARRAAVKKRHKVYLFVTSNVLGIACLAVFLLLVKGL